MKRQCLVRALSSSVALATCAVLFVAASPRAFSTIGFTLGATNRHARVFNNFTDVAANDNTTVHPNWPGATGAPLALWKAFTEWSSERHGDGSGDPTQPGDLGSGGANFDTQWRGLATSVGGPNDNIASEISGCASGLLSFTEYGSGGWRIRFPECFTWDDGPGLPISGALDLQGVAAHEYGHALGLGHSTTNGATMEPSITGTGLSMRSLAADDRAGIQYLYGVIAPTKPRVRAVTGAGSSSVTIIGENFAPLNLVQFLGGSIPDAFSSDGTVISVAVPSGVLAGDVQVITNPLVGAEYSNAYPFDPAGCAPPASYCVAKVNSQGCTPAIEFVGTPSASVPAPFLINARDVINNKTGLLFYGSFPASTPFQGGRLCIASPLRRTPVQGSGGNPPPNDCSGTFSYDFNARIQSGVDPSLVAGASVYAQYYYRDPPDAFATGLTDALAFTICP